MKKQQFLNTYINNVTLRETIDAVDSLLVKDQPSYVVEVNTDVIVKMEKDVKLKEISDRADLTLIDGQPLVWISRLLGQPVKEKISGSDLVPALCAHAAEKGYSIYFLGGQEGVAELAVQNLQKKYPNIRSAGTFSPPFGFEKDGQQLEAINRRIREARPDILFVCLGCPKQEKWIYDNYQKYGARLSVCAGATVDFLAGTIPRAPRWMSRCGLEWFFRFLKEPKRLFHRYFIDDIQILGLIWKYKFR